MTEILPTTGVSEEAEFLRQERMEDLRRSLEVVSPGLKAIQDELIGVWQECSRPGWDGYEARPLGEAALSEAFQFIQGLPWEFMPHTVSGEPGGGVNLEWYRSPNWLLDVVLAGEGKIYFSALFGERRLRGVEPLQEELPENLQNLIRRVLSG